MPRPVASLSLDLDNTWAYLRTGGDPAWSAYPSCLAIVVPRLVDALARHGLRITVFVVGKDASDDRHRDLLCSVVAAGHEMGNHSFHHEAWLHLFSDAEIVDDLARTEDAIEAATGRRPSGFRGPGYSLSAPTLRVLARRGYHYDASVLPTFIGPLARAYFFRTTGLDAGERDRLGALFGSFGDVRRPNRPCRWDLGGDGLLEIPVTTMPVLRTPIHLSYVLALAAHLPRVAVRYFRTALDLCARTGVAPSILLHSLDFADSTDAPELAFFPGMAIPHERKAEVIDECLSAMRQRFDVRTMGDQALAIAAGPPVPRVAPSFPARS